MLKTIILDLGKTIVPFDYQRGYARMSAASGLKMEEIRDRLAALELFAPFESGAIEAADFRARVMSALQVSLAAAEFDEIWSSVFYPETLIRESVLQELHRRRRMVLLSNTNAIHFDMLQRTYPHLRHFDAFVLSHVVRAMKPAPEIYAAAIAAAQCAPSECFFADDVAEYVEGARQAGIDAVQFTSEAQLLADLRMRGIEIG